MHGQTNKYTWEEQKHPWAPCVPEAVPVFSSSICSAPCFPIQIKQALQNLQDCFHGFAISWAQSQLEGVLGQVPKTQYLTKLAVLFFPLLGQVGVLRAVSVALAAQDFTPPGKQCRGCPRRKSVALLEDVYQSLAQSRWQHSGRRVLLRISREIFVPWACTEEMWSGSRQGWRSWEASLFLFLCLTVLQPPRHKPYWKGSGSLPFQHLPGQRAST